MGYKEPSWTLKMDHGPANSPHFLYPDKHNWIPSKCGLVANCECGAKLILIYNPGYEEKT